MKKKLFSIVLILSMVLTSAACSPSAEKVTGVEFDWDSAESISFSQFLKETSEAHKTESLDREALNDFENYIGEGESVSGILSEEELQLLLEERPLNNEHISTDQFKEDIDLLCRALKHYYGAYYYLGGDKTFDKVQSNMNKFVMDFDLDVPGSQLINVFKDYFDFIQDRDFMVQDESIVISSEATYDYYYCDLYFSKDETGYYTIAGGEKWYYESCRNEGVTIRPVLTPEGGIKYSPVLLRPSKRVRLDEAMQLACGEKQTTVNFNWIQGKPFSLGSSGEDFEFLEADGISYIRMKAPTSKLRQEIAHQFEDTCKEVQNSKLIIYDLRGCHGDAESLVRNWTANFTGDEPQLNSCEVTRKDGTSEFTRTEGTFSENDIPVIILVDSYTSTAGEVAMLYARTIENAIVIGSNTSGSQLTSNVQDICLPNSGVKVSIPTTMKMYNSMDNMDGIGYEPDIWCNPDTVMDTVENLISNEGYAEAGTFEQLDPVNRMVEEAMHTGPETKMIVLYDKYIIVENEAFGGENFNDDLIFMYDGQRISDYTITFENPDIARITYNEDGSVHIALPTPGNWPFYVNYKGESYKFILAV